MKKLTKAQSYREMLSEAKFPQLYSKRGFEKNRVRFLIPPDRTQFATITDKNGTHLSIEI